MSISDSGMTYSKDREHTFIEVEKDIKGSLIRVKRMDKEFIGTSMEQNTKADGWMIRKMDSGNLDILMAMYMKEIGQKGKSQDKEH